MEPIFLMIAAIVLAIVVFTILIKIVQATIKTALIVAAVVFLLNVVFGIGPDKVAQHLWQMIQTIVQATGNSQ
jgi:uncharacterized membrane protein